MANTREVTFASAIYGTPDSIDLDFGDGSAHATSLPATHTYDLDAIGTPYQVTAVLTVTTDGKDSSISKLIDLWPGQASQVIERDDGIYETSEGAFQ